MPAKITQYYKRPAPEIVFEDDPGISTRRGEKECCVCNSNSSICVAEKGYTHNLTSVFAQTAAFLYT